MLVDARNVLRSTWPNIPEDEVVEACRRWAAAEGVRAVIVFDGCAPGIGVGEHATGDGCVVVGTGSESADDWIARAADRYASDGLAYRLVTSDRDLRARAGRAAEQTIGGGAFARTLLASSSACASEASA